MARMIDETIDFLKQKNNAIPPIVAVLALIGLGRLARLASIGLAAVWLADQVRGFEQERADIRPGKASDIKVDTSEEESFPASDPPGYSSVTAGAPD